MSEDNKLNNNLMEKALALGKIGAQLDEVPVGAIVVKNGDIIAAAHNLTELKKDPRQHAEMLALEQAIKITGDKYLTDCDLYVSLEPCPMCASAISLTRIKRLYFGAYDEKSGGVENGARIFNASSCHHKPEIYGGILEEECSDLITRFFEVKRTSKN